MKANRHARRDLRDDERGLATVVGAILLMAVLISTIVTYQVVWKPKMDANAEANHMDQILNQLSSIKSVMTQEANNLSTAGVTSPLTLARSSSGWFSTPAVPSEAQFVPGTSGVQMNASVISVFQSKGGLAVGASEAWQGVRKTTTVSDVSKILSFRLRIDSINSTNAPQNKNQRGDSIELALRDSSGNFAGNFTVSVQAYPSGYTVNYRVINAQFQTVYDQGESYFLQDKQSPYWVNLLFPNFRFDRILAATLSPFTIELNEHGLAGEYAITYVKQSASGGTSIVGAGGNVRTGFNPTFAGGSLVYNATNLQIPSQTYTLENGAVILTQGSRSVFKVPPPFEAAVVDTNLSVRLTIPSLTGTLSGLTGTRTVNVATTPLTSSGLAFQTPAITFNFTTEHPGLWARYWRTQMDTGFVPASYYSIHHGTDWASLTLTGPNGGIDDYDVSVNLNQASIQTSVEG